MGTVAHMTAGPEAAVVHAALWGDLEATIDAYEAGLLHAAPLTDPGHRAVVAAIAEVIDAGHAPFPERVIDRLVANGAEQADAVDAVVMTGVFEALGCRCGDLCAALAELNTTRERDRLEQRLLALAITLHRPGGVARVAHELGEQAA